MRITERIQREINNLLLCTRGTLFPRPQSISNHITFVSQFANPEWAEKVLKDGQSKTSDPHWKQSGAVSVEEYQKWVTTICGMTCTVMALGYFGKGTYQTITLAKDALLHGVYQEHTGYLSDMHYKEYVRWTKKYRLSAKLYSRLTLSGIKHILSSGGLVIVSVNPNIRGYNTAPTEQKGGHLVLVTGYDDRNGTVTLQNPSGFVSQNTHHNHTVTFSYFLTYFARRGIALY